MDWESGLKETESRVKNINQKKRYLGVGTKVKSKSEDK